MYIAKTFAHNHQKIRSTPPKLYITAFLQNSVVQSASKKTKNTKNIKNLHSNMIYFNINELKYVIKEHE